MQSTQTTDCVTKQNNLVYASAEKELYFATMRLTDKLEKLVVQAQNQGIDREEKFTEENDKIMKKNKKKTLRWEEKKTRQLKQYYQH